MRPPPQGNACGCGTFLLRGKSPSIQSPRSDPDPCPQPAPCSLPSITCSPRRAWWMVRLRLLCILNRMTLPVWLNLGAPATYTRPCLEDTTDVTVYPVEGGNRLVSGARCSVGLAGFCHGAQPGLRRSTELCFSCAHGLIKESGDLAQWRACGWLMQTEPCT